MQWYISGEAVRQYMAIMDNHGDFDGPDFDAAAVELENLCKDAKLAKEVGPNNRHQQWRVKATIRGGKRTRLELIVSLSQRSEGSLPQLIAVRNKGA